MVLVYKDMQIKTLEDIQKLKVKDLREILRSYSEATGGIKADLVFKSLRDTHATRAMTAWVSAAK